MFRPLRPAVRLLGCCALCIVGLSTPVRSEEPARPPLHNVDVARLFPLAAEAAPRPLQRIQFVLPLPPFSPETMPADAGSGSRSWMPFTVAIRLDSGRPVLGEGTRLYAAYAALQVLDVHSTTLALGSGAREANPVVAGVAGNSVALFAVKGASAAATIALARRLSKKHPVAGALLMSALNTVSATVVAHNYRASSPAAGGRSPR